MSRLNGPPPIRGCVKSTQYSQEIPNIQYVVSTRSASSGFNSIFKWLKKNDRVRADDIDSSTSSSKTDSNSNNLENKLWPTTANEHCNGFRDSISPQQQPERTIQTINGVKSLTSSSSSSCDSLNSTATTGFAFIPPTHYRPYGEAIQPEKFIVDSPSTDTYRKRVIQFKNAREYDKKHDLTLRKKYNFFVSDSEHIRIIDRPVNGDSLREVEISPHKSYQDIEGHSSNTFNSGHTLKVSEDHNRKCKRSVSDRTNERKSGSYVHVKGKRKAPEPPILEIPTNKSNSINNQTKRASTLSPISTYNRKKRKAPQPPVPLVPTVSHTDERVTIFSTGFLDDVQIRALTNGVVTNSCLTPDSDGINSSNIVNAKEMNSGKIDLNYRKSDNYIEQKRREALKFQVEVTSPRKNKPSQLNNNTQVSINSENLNLVKEISALKVSPIFPRPWYKRSQSNNNKDYAIPFKKEIVLRTMEKRKIKDSTGQVSHISKSSDGGISIRNSSIFEGFFKRMHDHYHSTTENPGCDSGKRKSGIGIPNISELDKEAAKIVSLEYASERARLQSERNKYFSSNEAILGNNPSGNEFTERNLENRTTKDLIAKFETASGVQQSGISADRFFEKTLENIDNNNKKLLKSRSEETRMTSSSPNSVVCGITKRTWICQNCTLENPYWRIICQACERIKPYEMNHKSTENLPMKSTDCERSIPSNQIKKNYSDPKLGKDDKVVWERKAEKVLKYFRPRSNPLSKSTSESSVGNSVNTNLDKNRLSGNRLLLGSPKLIAKKNINTSSQQQISKPHIIESKTIKTDIVSNKVPSKIYRKEKCGVRKGLIDSSEVVTTITPVFLAPDPIKVPLNLEKDNKHLQTPIETEIKINGNADSSSNEKLPMKSKHNSLEREKQRLREMIRAMNERALSEKYPVHKKGNNTEEKFKTEEEQRNLVMADTSADIPDVTSQFCDSRKLGAIKKLFIRKNDPDIKNTTSKIPMNSVVFDSERSGIHKVSTSVQTAVIRKPEYIHQSVLLDNMTSDPQPPDKTDNGISPNEILNFSPNFRQNSINQGDNLTKSDNKIKDTDNLEKISFELNTSEGLANFKSTLQFSSNQINNTNTIALNKIMRDLEEAIEEGQHETAATLAMNLAKMKVSLCVTKQNKSPLQQADKQNIMFDVYPMGTDRNIPFQLETDEKCSILEIKKKVFERFQYPIEYQCWIVNDNLTKDTDVLCDLQVCNNSKIYLQLNSTESRDQFDLVQSTLHEKDDLDIEGAAALPLLAKSESLTDARNVPVEGWVCPLCTLINDLDRPGCNACSEVRPKNYLDCKENEQKIICKNDFPEELRRFLYDGNTQITPKLEPIKSNDLNRLSINRKSTEIYNIVVQEELTDVKITLDEKSNLQNGNHILPGPSPNITKNKYRGVDNFNPSVKKSTDLKPLAGRRKIIEHKKYLAPKPPIEKSTCESRTHYLELLNLDNTEAVTNSEPFECPVCLMEFGPADGIVLRDCLHVFCRECINNTINFSEEAEVKCPYMDVDYSCDSVLQDREIKALTTKDEYEQHLAKSLRVAEHKIVNAFHCKTPNCRGWCIYEDNVNQFKCPICKIINCLTCRVIHDGLNCKQYQEQMDRDCDSNVDAKRTKNMLADMIEKGDAMNCPTCHIVLMKKWGCDWLKCSMCKTEICWVTRGLRWGPEGKGDTSGGCRCGVAGKKCHPKCNYCH